MSKNKDQVFIKKVKKPSSLDPQQKALLNRKANQYFNEGNYEKANQIYVTTGYSDGLRRMSEYYKEQKDYTKALQTYCLSGHSGDEEDLVVSTARIISDLLKEGD